MRAYLVYVVLFLGSQLIHVYGVAQGMDDSSGSGSYPSGSSDNSQSSSVNSNDSSNSGSVTGSGDADSDSDGSPSNNSSSDDGSTPSTDTLVNGTTETTTVETTTTTTDVYSIDDTCEESCSSSDPDETSDTGLSKEELAQEKNLCAEAEAIILDILSNDSSNLNQEIAKFKQDFKTFKDEVKAKQSRHSSN